MHSVWNCVVRLSFSCQKSGQSQWSPFAATTVNCTYQAASQNQRFESIQVCAKRPYQQTMATVRLPRSETWYILPWVDLCMPLSTSSGHTSASLLKWSVMLSRLSSSSCEQAPPLYSLTETPSIRCCAVSLLGWVFSFTWDVIFKLFFTLLLASLPLSVLFAREYKYRLLLELRLEDLQQRVVVILTFLLVPLVTHRDLLVFAIKHGPTYSFR